MNLLIAIIQYLKRDKRGEYAAKRNILHTFAKISDLRTALLTNYLSLYY